MKKMLSLLLCVVFCILCASCGDGESQSNTNSSDSVSVSVIELLNQEDVKISFSGTSKDIGVGAGICLFVENYRTESIVVNIAEVSFNDVMQTVIQPQMPLHLTSPSKKSTQTFIFTNTKELSGKAQFKIRVMTEKYEEIFVSDFVEVTF